MAAGSLRVRRIVGLSDGDTARLKILNERLRRLSPRVTDEDVAQAAEMVTDAEEIAARLATMKAKLGLR